MPPDNKEIGKSEKLKIDGGDSGTFFKKKAIISKG
jgi:hypothetical protein